LYEYCVGQCPLPEVVNSTITTNIKTRNINCQHDNQSPEDGSRAPTPEMLHIPLVEKVFHRTPWNLFVE
jgi:hypothetical protein